MYMGAWGATDVKVSFKGATSKKRLGTPELHKPNDVSVIFKCSKSTGHTDTQTETLNQRLECCYCNKGCGDC